MDARSHYHHRMAGDRGLPSRCEVRSRQGGDFLPVLRRLPPLPPEERVALADDVRRLTLDRPQSDSTDLVREDRDR